MCFKGSRMSLPSSVVEVNYEGVVSKLLKRFIMMSIHVACPKRSVRLLELSEGCQKVTYQSFSFMSVLTH